MTDYVTKDPVTGEIYDQTDKRPDSGSQVNPRQDVKDVEYQKDVDEAAQYVYLKDVGQWKIGYIALRVTKRWSRDEKKKALIKFASDIQMPHPRQIYDIHQTAEFFPESAYAYIAENLKFISWSHCRAVVRHVERLLEDEGKSTDFEEAMDWLNTANTSNINVEDFEASLKSKMIDTWLTKRKRIPAKVARAYVRDAEKVEDRIGIVELHVDPVEIMKIRDLMQTNESQKDCIQYLMLRWLEKRLDKNK